uniref:Uncharacterized protein n=1 Tax=Romanomermis culicivorax TaxID=13658 RepID=A0A915KJJ9_ROMCU
MKPQQHKDKDALFQRNALSHVDEFRPASRGSMDFEEIACLSQHHEKLIPFLQENNLLIMPLISLTSSGWGVPTILGGGSKIAGSVSKFLAMCKRGWNDASTLSQTVHLDSSQQSRNSEDKNLYAPDNDDKTIAHENADNDVSVEEADFNAVQSDKEKSE